MKTFYLQDSRSYLGNSMLWWAKDGKGCTTDLENAAIFSEEEAMKQHRQRKTDIPWPVEYITERMQLTVDMQYVRRSHLIERGIQLQPAKPIRKENMRCCHCGVFMGYVENHRYICPKCAGDNRP